MKQNKCSSVCERLKPVPIDGGKIMAMNKDDKLKALDAAITQIEKSYGTFSVRFLDLCDRRVKSF